MIAVPWSNFSRLPLLDLLISDAKMNWGGRSDHPNWNRLNPQVQGYLINIKPICDVSDDGQDDDDHPKVLVLQL